MSRVTMVLALVFLALAVPLGWFIQRSYESLTREETAAMRFVAVALFDAMEEELAQIVAREETRPVDAWQAGEAESQTGGVSFPKASWIIGYLQHNPDGSMDMPVQQAAFSAELRTVLRQANEEIATRAARDDGPYAAAPGGQKEPAVRPNEKFFIAQHPPEAPAAPSAQALQAAPGTAPPRSTQKDVVSRNTSDSPMTDAARDKGLLDQVAGMISSRSRDYLGQDRGRTQIVTQDQARNIARQEQRRARPVPPPKPEEDPEAAAKVEELAQALDKNTDAGLTTAYGDALQQVLPGAQSLEALLNAPPRASIQVEVAPLQSMVLNEGRIFLYRRIVIGGRIYRQGLLIDGTRFLQHLMDRYFRAKQLPEITSLALAVMDKGRTVEIMADGLVAHGSPALSVSRQFPRPFSFLQAELLCPAIPVSEARATLNTLAWALAVVLVGGFVAVYRSARALNELSQRRAGFVSSVTHELKTPLTTIRMYAEMLEQGMAPSREREEEYLRTVSAEAERLSRLIGNVLEFAKLEKRTRRFEMQEGELDDALDEVRRVLGPSLNQAGFTLEEDIRLTHPFPYDREAMVQILLNLVENSIKFTMASERKHIAIRATEEHGKVLLCVEDSGPGVPSGQLRKIFNDFYRVDDSLTRKTKGTGLGLALVKRLAEGMGGKVWAENVPEGGLRVWLRLE
ncbi:sensor histidine kinase [Megalodesulfovibrio paquesii]